MKPPLDLLTPGRRPRGYSAILLPFQDDGQPDIAALAEHVERTARCGLVPAVNMDTGFGHLIDVTTKQQVLSVTREVLGAGAEFVAGAFCKDQPGAGFNLDEYARQMDLIQKYQGTPVIFQSYGLVGQPGDAIVQSYEAIAERCDQFIAFELKKELGPFGAIYDLETYAGLMGISKCIGAKHSSFHREPEWDRLRLRNQQRPDFRVFTGNDFGIDMIMYGSDYLLGLSTFAPDFFARRDGYWEDADPRFYELNDLLQYLGFLTFRDPGPGYKHSAAQFLKLRGWIGCDATHPQSPTRPASDVAILQELLTRLEREHSA